jgi:N-acetylneuraminic acid mutarotase
LFLLGLVACSDPEPKPPEDPWQVRAALPEGRIRLEASAAARGTELVVLGGFSTAAPSLEITREVLLYDPFTDTWAISPLEAPAAFTHAGLASVGGTLYLLGGLEGTVFAPSGKTWRLRPGAEAWDDEAVADIPEGLERGAAAVVVSSGHIFLLGGETAFGFTDSILDYNITSNTWSELPFKLPTPRSHAAAMRDGDGMFVLAGGNGPQGPLGDTWVHRLGAPAWEPRAAMNTARAGCAYGVVYGSLVCAGGEVGMAVTRAVETYDPTDAMNAWDVQPDLPLERGGAPGAVVTSRLYVIGGSQSTAFEPTSTLYEFDLLDTIPR